MNMDQIESFVIPRLQRALGREVQVKKGPYSSPQAGGIYPEVYVHAREYTDFGGVTRDGAHISRQPIKASPFSGFIEQRPGRIVVAITAVSASYAIMQKLCADISAIALLSLETLPPPELGALEDGSVQLTFDDFVAILHSAVFEREKDETSAYYCGRLIFFLEGFLHSRITRRGKFRSPRKPPQAISTEKRTIKKARAKRKTTTSD